MLFFCNLPVSHKVHGNSLTAVFPIETVRLEKTYNIYFFLAQWQIVTRGAISLENI